MQTEISLFYIQVRGTKAKTILSKKQRKRYFTPASSWTKCKTTTANSKYWLQNILRSRPMGKGSLPVDSSVTMLWTCCMAKLTKLSFDRSPLYFTAACGYINIFYFFMLKASQILLTLWIMQEVLLLNNTVHLQMIPENPDSTDSTECCFS